MDFRVILIKSPSEQYDISESSYLRQIDEAISEIKEDSGREMEYMTMTMKMMDERKEAFEQGESKGRTKEQAKIIKRMLSRGLSLEDISDMIGLDLEEVEKLAGQE